MTRNGSILVLAPIFLLACLYARSHRNDQPRKCWSPVEKAEVICNRFERMRHDGR